MTIQRPDLTAAELQGARDAWMLVQLGHPIPTQYLPAAMKVAEYCFARGYDHDDAAEARPVFLHPDGGAEGVPGVYGANRTGTPTQLAAWIAKRSGGTRPKGTGPMFSPGHSWRGDGEGPMAPLQRGDERCRAIGWLFLDADNVGEWTPILNAIGKHGGAYVRGRSGSHCPAGRSCELHPKGQTKWHLAVPLRETYSPPANPNVARAEWKGELYAAARFAFHLMAEVTGRGFDRQLDQFLCRMYVGAPYDRAHRDIPREVHGQEGLGFDIRACWAGLEELGVVDPAQVHASRVAATLPPGTAWDEADGEPPMVAAFKVAGLYVQPMASGKHLVVCPFESTHTSGKTGDSSTILWPNGKFLCSHSHSEGRAAGGAGMREVLAMLPPEAQAAHAQARTAARARERSTSARRETALNQDDSEGRAVDATEPPAAEGEREEGAAANELAMLLAQIEADVLNATGALFIKRASQLPRREFMQLHDALKRAKVPLREFNAAVAERRKERAASERQAEAEARIERASTGRPKVVITHDEERITEEAVSAVGQHAELYQRGGSLVNVRRDLSQAQGVTRPKDAPRIAMVPVPTLRDYLASSAVWVRVGEEGQRRVGVPQSVVLAVHARGEWRGVRTLEAVVETPMLRPDGTILAEPGFDVATGLLYVPGETFPPVPDCPTQDEARAAGERLFDVVADFPFKTRAHRAAWLASALTPLARPAFLGCSPLNLVDANVAGAGKGLLMNVTSGVVAGRDFAVMPPVNDEDEQRKSITSIALSGDPMVLIDNVAGTLGGASLDAALTSTTWGGRLLGGNQHVKIPLVVTWYATGNNVQLTGDMQRRVLHIRLESPEDHPEDRRGFRHPKLKDHVRDHRAALVVAALTILRGYCAAGRPRHNLVPWGSFEGWSDLIREAIVWIGEPDPHDTCAEVRSEADIAGQALRNLLEGWPKVAARHGGKCTVVKILHELARNEAAANSVSSGETLMYEGFREALSELIQTLPGKLPTPRQLGNTIRRFKGRVVLCTDNKRRVLTMPKEVTNGGAIWMVREVTDRVTGDSGESGDSSDASSTHASQSFQGSEGDSEELSDSAIPLRMRAGDDFADVNYTHTNGGGAPADSPNPPESLVEGEDEGPQWPEDIGF